jgi:Flp pilus assembly protein TadG
MRRFEREDGQVLPLLVLGVLVVALGIAAIVIDVGHAYLVKRQLQSTADAAALAAADVLPSTTTALSAASEFGPTNKNRIAGVDVTQTAKAWCLKSQTNCYGNAPNTAPTNGKANGIVVTETAAVPTTFAKLFGIDSINVSAKSTACGNCHSQPLDIALVLDRTGSMDLSGSMPALRAGVKAFLQSLDPATAYVTLLVLPPAGTAGSCSPPQTWSPSTSDPFVAFFAPYFYPPNSSTTYTVVRMSHDYKTGSALNTSSPLVQAVDCLAAGGPTAYKEALMAAQDELVNHGSGRANAKRVIVFETDGAANTVPWSWVNSSTMRPGTGHTGDFARPCGSAVDYLNNVAKPSGTTVFTVAYALSADDDCYQAPHATIPGETPQVTWSGTGYIGYRTFYGAREQISAQTALTQMASTGDAYTAANQASMSTTFQAIGDALMSASLVPDGEGG